MHANIAPISVNIRFTIDIINIVLALTYLFMSVGVGKGESEAENLGKFSENLENKFRKFWKKIHEILKK